MTNENDFVLESTSKYEAFTVYFDTDKANVKGQDLDQLNTVYKLMKKHPELKVPVSAYADDSASDEYNFLLSQKRGEWIVNYLVKKGIDRKRFTVNAYGETLLIDPENDALNRRAELRIYL